MTHANLKKGIYPQLPVYALALIDMHGKKKLLEKPTTTNLVLCHWYILDGTFKIFTANEAYSKAIKEFFNFEKRTILDTELINNNTLDALNLRLEQIESDGRFAIDTAHCKYCDYPQICRKDD